MSLVYRVDCSVRGVRGRWRKRARRIKHKLATFIESAGKGKDGRRLSATV